jgi:putative FmdB family regulatory protein
MPIYEYECRECGQRFERMQSFHDEPIRVCPHCGGETRRVFHPVGVIFKGSGWYITDSRKSNSESTGSTATSGDKSDKAESAGSKAGESPSSTPAAKDSTSPAPAAPKAGSEA